MFFSHRKNVFPHIKNVFSTEKVFFSVFFSVNFIIYNFIFYFYCLWEGNWRWLWNSFIFIVREWLVSPSYPVKQPRPLDLEPSSASFPGSDLSMPAFYMGTVVVDSVHDVFLRMDNWTHVGYHTRNQSINQSQLLQSYTSGRHSSPYLIVHGRRLILQAM